MLVTFSHWLVLRVLATDVAFQGFERLDLGGFNMAGNTSRQVYDVSHTNLMYELMITH